MGFGAEKTADPIRAVVLGQDFEAMVKHVADVAGGKVFASGGELCMVEFDSAGTAVSAARALLQKLEERNAGALGDRGIIVRAAVTMGEYEAGGRGPTGPVPAAAGWLVNMADPGGLVLGEEAYRHVRRQIPLKGAWFKSRKEKDAPGGIRAFVVSPPSTGWLGWSIRKGLWLKPAAVVIVLAALGWVGWNHFALVAGQQAPATPPTAVAIPESILLLNSFETKDGIFPYSGDGAKAAFDVVPGGVSGNALAVWFEYPGGKGFWGISLPVKKDCRAFTGIRISVRSPQAADFRIVLKDGDEYWDHPVTTGPEYKVVSVPFKDFTFRKDFNRKVDGILDLAGITGVELIQMDTGTGTIYLDDLQLYGPMPGTGR